MKREILFKAKHIHALPENEWMEGKWVEGFLSGEDYINDGTYEYMIDPDTICQYTGLTDKKGRLLASYFALVKSVARKGSWTDARNTFYRPTETFIFDERSKDG